MYSEYPSNVKSNKKEGPSDNYSGRARRNEQIHKHNPHNNNINEKNEKEFQQTKTKIKITLFKNGFMVNNGPFRNIKIKENKKFIEQVERGIIPHELVMKGIDDLGILLENRKNEEYITSQMPSNLEAYIQGNLNINTTNINQNIYTNNIYPNININNKQPNTQTNNKTTNPVPVLNQDQDFNNYYNTGYYNYINEPYQPYKNDLNNLGNLNTKEIKTTGYNNIKNTSGAKEIKRHEKAKIDKNNMCLTPIGMRGNRMNIFPEKGKELENSEKKLRQSSESKKKETKNFRTFGSWIKEEKAKEDEEKKRKTQKNQEKTNEEKEEKKFVPFGGEGYLIDNVDIKGLHVTKDLKNKVNKQIPICHFNIRLFNGEIIKCEFNYTQTLRDVYIYVKTISGSNNFILLEGFPPKPLNQLNKYIKELKLDNTTLTQKIN